MRSKFTLRSRILARASTVVIASAAASAIVSTPAYASYGGGCHSSNEVNVCISAQGNSLLPDFYVDTTIPGCLNLELRLYDETYSTVSVDLHGLTCNVGHHGPWQIPSNTPWTQYLPINNHVYQTQVYIDNSNNGTTGYYLGFSPVEYFLD